MKRKLVHIDALVGKTIHAIHRGYIDDDHLLAVLTTDGLTALVRSQHSDHSDGTELILCDHRMAGFVDRLTDKTLMAFELGDEADLAARKAKRDEAEARRIRTDDLAALDRLQRNYPDLLQPGVTLDSIRSRPFGPTGRPG